jgi:hypothetical protein
VGTSEASEIHRRVEDANVLWRLDRREGAFILALVAVGAAARRAHPALHDQAAFETYLLSQRSWRISVEYRGEQIPVETVLYKLLRCQLVHEAGMAADLEFLDGVPDDDLVLRAGGAPEHVLKVSPGWFQHLIECALAMPQWRSLFGLTSSAALDSVYIRGRPVRRAWELPCQSASPLPSEASTGLRYAAPS